MIRRIAFELDEVAFPWLMGFIATMEHALKIAIKVTIKEVDEDGHISSPSGDRSTVKYAVAGGREALKALGYTTIIGILFAHLCDHGPMTAKELAASKPYNKKTIESTLWKLRHMDLIQSQGVEG